LLQGTVRHFENGIRSGGTVVQRLGGGGLVGDAVPDQRGDLLPRACKRDSNKRSLQLFHGYTPFSMYAQFSDGASSRLRNRSSSRMIWMSWPFLCNSLA